MIWEREGGRGNKCENEVKILSGTLKKKKKEARETKESSEKSVLGWKTIINFWFFTS